MELRLYRMLFPLLCIHSVHYFTGTLLESRKVEEDENEIVLCSLWLCFIVTKLLSIVMATK